MAHPVRCPSVCRRTFGSAVRDHQRCDDNGGGVGCRRALLSRWSAAAAPPPRDVAAVNYDSPRDIIESLRRHHIGPKKRWGQNFLIDGNVRRAIAALAMRDEAETLWEIGPGIGALTELLVQTGPVTAFEIDWGIIRFLKRQFERAPLSIVAGDAVATIGLTARDGAHGTPDVVVGNLPYRRAAAIIAALVDLQPPPRRIVVTVQKEMAERLVAAPGTRDYSAFSVTVQSVCSVERAFDISAACFYPAPEVISTVVKLTRRDDRLIPVDRALFLRVKDALFARRRKTVVNNLKHCGNAGVSDAQQARLLLQRCGIDPAARAETLAPEAFVRLADEVYRLQQSTIV
ncbi:MAG: ribosomal RNA small subunit methyltransferase A [Spirochaetaceae bacterium]|nr:MAG: ribosomal RNA small subunit methyltransferase A [Spirochaetaceae bacterium]